MKCVLNGQIKDVQQQTHTVSITEALTLTDSFYTLLRVLCIK